MSAYSRHVVQLLVNARDVAGGLVEASTGREPVIAHGVDVEFQILLLDGPVDDEAVAAVDVSDLTGISVAVMPTTRRGDALMGKTVGGASITARTRAEFDAGAGVHAVVEFDYSETEILEDTTNDTTYWLVIYGRAVGRKLFGCGAIRVIRPGIPANDTSDISGTLGRLHQGQQQLLTDDGWYSVTVATVDGVLMVVMEQSVFAGTYDIGTVGSTWGVHDGQLCYYTGTAWRGVIRTLDQGIMVLSLGDEELGETPNGVLDGTDYRVRSGRCQARNPVTNLWHPMSAETVDGVLTLIWSDSSTT